jgi:hypothetical protein
MITLKRLNVVRKVATEEQAAKLERLGFTRMGGAAEPPAGAGITEANLAKMGEDMFERLSKNLKEAVAKATAQPPKKGKGAKGDDKEGQDGGTDQPGSGDGAE